MSESPGQLVGCGVWSTANPVRLTAGETIDLIGIDGAFIRHARTELRSGRRRLYPGHFMTSLFRRVAAIALIAATGCSVDRSPTAVTPSAPSARSGDLLGGLTGVIGSTLSGVTGLLTTVHGVRRTTPLAAPITVTKVIGLYGGSLSIPQAGVTVVVPYGALKANTEITMTARAGSMIAYDFAPHGIVFAKPLVFSQNLRGTTASLLTPLSLKLAYYDDPSLLGETTAVVSELITGVTNLLTGTFTSTIPHFSGYLLACGSGDAY
jgi:hypothetical protein